MNPDINCSSTTFFWKKLFKRKRNPKNSVYNLKTGKITYQKKDMNLNDTTRTYHKFNKYRPSIHDSGINLVATYDQEKRSRDTIFVEKLPNCGDHNDGKYFENIELALEMLSLEKRGDEKVIELDGIDRREEDRVIRQFVEDILKIKSKNTQAGVEKVMTERSANTERRLRVQNLHVISVESYRSGCIKDGDPNEGDSEQCSDAFEEKYKLRRRRSVEKRLLLRDKCKLNRAADGNTKRIPFGTKKLCLKGFNYKIINEGMLYKGEHNNDVSEEMKNTLKVYTYG